MVDRPHRRKLLVDRTSRLPTWQDLLVETPRPIEKLRYGSVSFSDWSPYNQHRNLGRPAEIAALRECRALPKLRVLTVVECVSPELTFPLAVTILDILPPTVRELRVSVPASTKKLERAALQTRLAKLKIDSAELL